MLQATYSLPLVLASLFIASLAAYTALDLSGRIHALSNPAQRRYWLAGGAVSMGLGIWCMHFVGMLSFSLPIPLGYDAAITVFSLFLAVVVSYFVLRLASRGKLSPGRRLVSGGLMGLGIAGMHYSGMAAMRMTPAIEYDPAMVALSILIAVAASTAALWIAAALRSIEPGRMIPRRMAAAVVMGFAISGMHYTGMAAASFPLGSVCGAASEISVNWLATTVAGATFAILTITLVLSILDLRMEMRTSAFVESLQKANAELQHQATHDVLTGLPNRVLLFERIQHAIHAAERTGGLFAVYFVDIDGFKYINDSLGHATGDQLLCELARALTECVRKEDTVARLAGDEFVVMVEGIPDVAMAGHIADKLLQCFRTDLLNGADNGAASVTGSIGIAIYPEDGSTVDELLSHADSAMYLVKGNGRNAYQFFEPALNEAALRVSGIQRALPRAIHEGEFFLQYQPKLDCASQDIVGAEALLRWQHPVLGLVSPAEFIPIAERSGQINEVGLWVLEQVCRQLRAWQDEGLRTKVAVNLSQMQLRSQALLHDVLSITSRYGIAPDSLMFEITETVAMQHAEDTLRVIDQLQQAGFQLAIDDFGTGYSSLSYLQQFGVRQLKVDGSFVRNLDAGKGRAIVEAIIRLAHSLDMEVVAEGVETGEQRKILCHLECDQLQGFHLARPLDEEQFVSLLRSSGARSVEAGPPAVAA